MKKTPLKKRAKTHTNPWWRKKAVEVAKLISKHLGEYTCVTCGRSSQQGYQIHGSHILPESKYQRMSCVPDNIMCQCARCHMDWHENPAQSFRWFEDKFPDRFNNLTIMAEDFDAEITKPDYQKITKQLKEEYNKLIN